MSSGDTAKSTASDDLAETTREDAGASRTETTSDVSEVAKRVADPQHAETAAASFDGSSEAAAARDAGDAHDASDALDAYARISMPGASTASASDAASSESFLAWLKSDSGTSKRAAVDAEPPGTARDEARPSKSVSSAGESLAIVSGSESSPTSDELPEAKAKDAGNSLMTHVPSAAEIAAVEASLDSLGLSKPPPPPAQNPQPAARAAASVEVEPARDSGARTSVEELTADEVIERVSVEPVEVPVPLTRPASVTPPPLPDAALNKPPTIAPPPLPKGVAPQADSKPANRDSETDALLAEHLSLVPDAPDVRPLGERVSAPSLEALAGPNARVTTRPPPDADDPLAMPSLASTAATALSLVPPALGLVERTTEPPPPKTGAPKSGPLKPPPSPKTSRVAAHDEPQQSGGNSLFGGMVGFVLGCVATAFAMKAATPPSTANAGPSQAAVCAEPTGSVTNTSAASVATPSTSATTRTENATPPAVSEPASTTSASSTPASSSTDPTVSVLPPPSVAPAATEAVSHAGSPAVNDANRPTTPATAPTATTATPTTTASPLVEAEHHHHHGSSTDDGASGATSGTSGAHAATTAGTSGSASSNSGASSGTAPSPTTTAHASDTHVAPAANDSTESASMTCARRCGGNADCLIACHRGGGSTASTTSASADHDAPPAANDPPPVAAPDHDLPPRDEVVDAMGRIREAVVHCATGDENNPTHANQVSVTFTFASSGRVTIALVGAPFAGTPAGSCIARAARGAHVEPFAQSSFRVVYPFTM